MRGFARRRLLVPKGPETVEIISDDMPDFCDPIIYNIIGALWWKVGFWDREP